MAGDWMKIEKATARKPEVIRLAVALSIRPDEAFGLCFRFWAWCDDQVSDGKIRGFTEDLIDATVDRPGFASALVSVGWLQAREGSLVIPNFDRHLSHSAKTRAEASIRKKKERSKAVTKMSQKNVTDVTEKMDENVTIEKRREEKRNTNTNIPPPACANGDDLTFLRPPDAEFRRWWSVLPEGMRSAVDACWRIWPHVLATIQTNHPLDEPGAVDHLIHRTKLFAQSPKGRTPEFRWNPLTFLKDGHYDDSVESWENHDGNRNTGRRTSTATRPENLAKSEANDVLAGLGK